MKATHYIISATLLTAVSVTVFGLHQNKERYREERQKSLAKLTVTSTERSNSHATEAVHLPKINGSEGLTVHQQPTTYSSTETAVSYSANHTIGSIGLVGEAVSDNPEDNLFEVVLGDAPRQGQSVWLEYDLKGASAASGVSKSINDRMATGGYLSSPNDDWIKVQEAISPEWLQSGINRILFTAPKGSNGYLVRNLQIRVGNTLEEALTLSSTPVSHKGKVYLHGFTDGTITQVLAGGISLPLYGNEFEGMISDSSFTGTIELTLLSKDGKTDSRTVPTTPLEGEIHERVYTPMSSPAKKTFLADTSDSLSTGAGKLIVGEHALQEDKTFTISSLRSSDLPALDFGMTNVTAEGEGCRFLPHGEHFIGAGATVSIKYDRTKIPSGFTEEDINTYYFDSDAKHWVALERVKIDKEHGCVVSKTTHFTDMINGVIQAPESPETDGFTPTMMQDIKATAPTAKMNFIAPPVANNRGSANLQYAFEMPPARNGMAPSLGIQYNSEGGSGWLGEGWDLPIPTITLDTRWGVPRYDLQKETETYLMSGSMLSTMDDAGNMGVAHRGEKMSRKVDRQFYTRQGGDFSRIVRKGDTPSNYFWEVTDRQGIKYTYGGDGAVLKGSVGSGSEVISEWLLKRIEEPHGDYIEYVYQPAEEEVIGGLKAKAIYLKEVHAGNKGQTPHTVVTFEGNKEKQLKSNNARYGFLTSSNRLLEKVTVTYQGTPLRYYTFTYKEGAFGKDILTSIKQFDDQGENVAFHTLNYYDDVQSHNGYIPFRNEQETWQTHNDGLDAGFINPLGSTNKIFSDKPTALGGTTSTSFSGGFYAGVGVLDGSPWKGNTVGGAYNYSRDTNKGLSTLADLNGDGLPDKVFRKDGALYYRPRLSETDENGAIYGESIRVKGISSFSTVKSTTNSGGASATPGYMNLTAVVGVDVSRTKTETTEYFSDINGDGLVDLVSNGKVYFNHIEWAGEGKAVPTFTLSSADTPSPIIYGGKIDPSVFTIDPEEQQELLRTSPMQDMVRLWQAPKDGTINISGTVQLIIPTGDYDANAYAKADGVRIAIQVGATEQWNKRIAKDDATAYNASVQNITIKKGDRIYFRVQSGTEEMSNGAFDQVKWAPIITYTGATETMPNGYSTTTYIPAEGAIYDVNTSVQMESGVPVTLSGRFVKPVTTDDVTITIYASNNKQNSDGSDNASYVEKPVFSKTYPWNEAIDTELTSEIANVEKLPNFRAEISATTNVAWTDIRWTPSISYKNEEGADLTMQCPAHYVVYAEPLYEGIAYINNNDGVTLKVLPKFASSIPFNGQVVLSAKTEHSLVGKRVYTVTGGTIASDTLTLQGVPKGKIWFEFHYPGIIPVVNMTSSEVLVNGTSVKSSFYAMNGKVEYGLLYRGWGGFVYNAAEGRYAKPINEKLLKLPEKKKDDANPLTMPFIPIGTDQTTLARWVGQHKDIYLTATEMGAARLSEQDVVLTNPLEDYNFDGTLVGDCLQGTGAIAFTQVATNKSTVNQTGALGVTHSDASGKAKTEVTMMDMNGDGFPDLVAGGTIQYTDSQGGMSGELYDGIGLIVSDNESNAWGYGGNPIASVSNIVNVIKGSARTMSNVQATWEAGFSITGSVPKNKDEAIESFVDINGDGLPDKILADKTVRLNLGYSFSKPVDWQLERIQGGYSLTVNAGAGGGAGGGIGDPITYKNVPINKASGSFSVGFGIVTAQNHEEYNLIDLNSDGLPDKVWTIKTSDKEEDSRIVMVALNNGAGFNEAIRWKGATALNESASTAESVNAAFTFNINVPPIATKFSVNPSASTGHAINRIHYSLMDVDGDGYLDIVESDKESELKVTRSTIGRTNNLKSVSNSLGGTFTIDYEHTTPTYDLPGGKWVMSSVTIDDGIRDDGPLTKMAFDYSEGRRERHEREFLGFGKVITKSLDTENGDAVYRQTEQRYDVSTYYAQGNELGTCLMDADGNKYTETLNAYDGYYLTTSGDQYTFNKQENLCSDRASAFVPLRYTANKQYEGASTGITTAEAWNEYWLDGHHGELKSYKFSDKGHLGENGTGAFDYQTSIQYLSNEKKHILGLPTDVVVAGNDGTIFHHVSAKYDMDYANHLLEIRQQLDGKEAVTEYLYDNLGNITKVTLPANSKGQRMWYSYRYEPVMNMYVERIDDAFGYRSEASNFDYRYGVALRRMDLNHFYYETEIDNLGRVKAVRGPNELSTKRPYLIAFEYHTKAAFGEQGITAPAYAITKHYDELHPQDDIETVTFVDGFGRAIQVKKDGVITTASKGSTPKDEEMMIVSGRNIYDAFGRVTKAYYPVTEPLGKKATFNKAFDDQTPTISLYDVLDRNTVVTLPDGSRSTTEYSIDPGSNTLVTTLTDALGHRQATYAKGTGKTVKTEQLDGPAGTITTSFLYDGIDRLTRVIDTEGNETVSTYDMGDRRIEVNHPSSGITSFTYDNLGNVLTKQTANLRAEGKQITYDYDYNRLVEINYPNHPENNVRYHYGDIHASENRIGRLILTEDGSGATEYFYGKMGEVVKTVRTMIVPNQAIATYITQWKYDSHNRLLELTYPDGEQVSYNYNSGGLLNHVSGYKSYKYDYVNKIGYDKFEQRTYLKYCNGAETFYTYDPQRRRLQNLAVNTKGKTIMDNAYGYDAVSNVLSIANNAPLPQSNKAGGQMSHQYTYDGLYRLVSATGSYMGADNKSASYSLNMGYDNMHRITQKSQHLSQVGVQFDGTLNAGYDLTYTYQNGVGHRFQLDNILDLNYRTEETPSESTTVNNGHRYEYDANGNLVYINTSRVKADGIENDKSTEQKFRWDEENRLLAVDENGYVSNYWYDANGERTVKESGSNEAVYVNSEFAGGRTNTTKFSLYVSPFFVATQGGRYTKHIYIGNQRIVSKLGDLASYGQDPRRIPYAGTVSDAISVDYETKYAQQQQVIKDNYEAFEVPYNGEDNNDYVNGQSFCCEGGTPKAMQTRAGDNFHDKDAYEKLQFYYHPDHLGSSNYITNLDGEVVQHIEYVPFGEVFIEERNNTWNTPYLFNAKELDEETGLYYYGARYYDPRLSLWMSTDPLQEKYPNISTYCYTGNNPIKYIDISGKAPIYSNQGVFLGTDDKGLYGDYIIMDEKFFTQGMAHSLAQKHLYTGNISPETYHKIWNHNAKLVKRPDYDGYVSISEGIKWAKEHPNALKNPTPENTLYIDASKLDFGSLSTSDFKKVGKVTAQNLFPKDILRALKSAFFSSERDVVYALGRVNMILLNREKREVKIVNDEATDYDWNTGGGSWRSFFINLERKRTGLNDTHGFKVFYYGTGHLKK